MKIKEKISPLLPYLKEIKFSENLILISGAFYPKWIIQENKNPLVKIHKGDVDENGKVTYHFYSENKSMDIDGLIEHFEEIITENLDRERKEDLFKKKVEELKTVFKTNTLTDLEKLEIDIVEDELEVRPGYTQIDD